MAALDFGLDISDGDDGVFAGGGSIEEILCTKTGSTTNGGFDDELEGWSETRLCTVGFVGGAVIDAAISISSL